jgi:hypothetical protein
VRLFPDRLLPVFRLGPIPGLGPPHHVKQRGNRRQRALRLDEAILEELERGPSTLHEVVVRLSKSKSVRGSLESLRADGRVNREGLEGYHYEFTSILSKRDPIKQQI